MKRKDPVKERTPDLILTSDWHLRDDAPPCRIDDFQEAQWGKVQEVSRLQQKYDCPVLHAGDLFHHWKPSPWLISRAIEELPMKFFTIAGQHDLPQHSLDLVDKSGIYALWTAGAIEWTEKAGNFGQDPADAKDDLSLWKWNLTPGRRVGVWHHFVWDGKVVPWPGCDEITAQQVLKKYPQYDLIVTGDHHKPFIYEYKGRLLVNCGCLTRQVADYANHQPRVYLWHADTNSVSIKYLNIADEPVVSREHIEEKEQRDQRIDAFISRLSDTWEVGLSFEENLKRFIGSNQLRKPVIDLLYKALEGR